jgi:hypothetical protein
VFGYNFFQLCYILLKIFWKSCCILAAGNYPHYRLTSWARRQWRNFRKIFSQSFTTLYVSYIFMKSIIFVYFSVNVISSLPFTAFLQAGIDSHFPCYSQDLEFIRKSVQSLFHNLFSRNFFDVMFVILIVLGNLKLKFELLSYG